MLGSKVFELMGIGRNNCKDQRENSNGHANSAGEGFDDNI
jgi:hypothetical protein